MHIGKISTYVPVLQIAVYSLEYVFHLYSMYYNASLISTFWTPLGILVAAYSYKATLSRRFILHNELLQANFITVCIQFGCGSMPLCFLACPLYLGFLFLRVFLRSGMHQGINQASLRTFLPDM